MQTFTWTPRRTFGFGRVEEVWVSGKGFTPEESSVSSQTSVFSPVWEGGGLGCRAGSVGGWVTEGA